MSAGGLPGPGQAESVCPVCWWPDDHVVIGDQCSWELRGGLTVPAAADDDRYLMAAQLYDLRAAMRVAGPLAGGDETRLTRLAKLARGGLPSAEQLERIGADIEAGEHGVAGTRFALTRLIAEETDAIAFIEVGPDFVAMDAWMANEYGVPFRSESETERITWTSVLRGLPDDPDLRHFRMAGGIGVDLERADGPAIIAAAIRKAARDVLVELKAAASASVARNRRHQPGRSRLDMILVRRTHQWPLLEVAATCARAIVRPIADIFVPPGAGALAEVVDSVVQGAPLTYGYSLLLAAVDQPAGTVTRKDYPLFPSGAAAAPDAPAAVSVIVKPPERAARRLALPIVAGRPGEERMPPHLVQMAAIDGTKAKPTRLTVQLEAPGRVSVWGAPLVSLSDGLRADWPRLLDELPSQIRPIVVLDLVLLVELGGEKDAVADRVGLAGGLVEAIDPSADVRVAVVGYRDHGTKHHHSAKRRAGNPQEQDDRDLLVGCALSSVDAVRGVLAEPGRWQAVLPRADAAPAEDALHLVAQPDWAWRPQARHVLVIVGRRPPHPARDRPGSGPAPACSYKYSWQVSLDRLRHDQDVRCFAVFSNRTRPEGVEQAWQAFIERAGFTAISPERLAQDLDIPTRASAAELRLATFAGPTAIRPRRREASR